MNINESFYCSRCLREMEDEGVCPFCGYDEDETAYDPQVLEEGTLLCRRRYRIGALIGRGGFGMTYAAWDQTLLAPVAIKEYFPDGYAHRDVLESNEVEVAQEDRIIFGAGLSNFSREAHILAALQNVDHVVKVYNCFEENGTSYIVMEYVRGMTLMQYVAEHKLSGEALLKMLRAPIDALVLIHAQGVMHRDITPNNLMVQEDGTIKLIDFGAAHVDERRLKGKSYSITATRHYAAPEQYDPDMQQGQWTDVYGLSATTYALLTGCEPPDSQERMKRDTLVPPRKMGKGLSKRQERALIEGLRMDPNHRLRSVEEFRSILYNLPTPEVVRQRKKVFWQMMTVMIAAAAAALVLAVNFALGFPLGEGLRYALYPDGWHVTGGAGAQQEIVIPKTRLMLPVTAIRDRAFEGSQARSADIAGSVKTIGKQAFYGCEALESVAIGRGAQEIGGLAFAGCSALHTVNLPSTLKSIGEYAFLNTPQYLTVWVPDAVKTKMLAKEAGVHYAMRGDYAIRVEDGEAVLTGYSCQSAEDVMASYIDGYPVTRIDEKCVKDMFGHQVSRIVLPYFLREVPDGLFDSGPNVREVEMGPYVQHIGKAAFKYTDIEHIDLPDALRSIGDEAFCVTNLMDIDLPDGLEHIGEDAFRDTKLTFIEVPASVQTMGEGAFSGNDSLISARLLCAPDTLEDQFASCPNLKTVELPEGIRKIEMLAFREDISLEHMILPESLEEIKYGAFSECIGLEYVDIPNGTAKIDAQAFDGCSGDLIIAGVPGSAAQTFALDRGYRFEDKTLSTPGLIQDGVINASDVNGSVICPAYDEETKSLIRIVKEVEPARLGLPFTSIVLPSCATEIAYAAFADTEIEHVVLPRTLERMDSSVFEGCTALETIDLPQGLEWIGYGAFEDCTNLKSADLPSGLRVIGQSAFENCASLTEVTIPPLVTTLNARSFSGTAIESVVIPGSVMTCASTFEGCAALQTAVVEEGCREMYDTFRNCPALTTLSLPSTLDSISAYEYEGCTALTDVYIYGMETMIFCDAANYSLEWESKALTQRQKENSQHPFRDAKNVTIHAYEGSAAQKYAEAFGLRFEPIEKSAQ